MFCGKCGRPVEDGKTLCEECAAAQTAEIERQEPQTETGEIPAPVTEVPAFTVNTDTELPDKKTGKRTKEKSGKKSRKMLYIILGIVAGVLAVAALLTALFWPYVSSFWKRTFMKPEDYLQSVEQNAAEADPMIDTIGNIYQFLLNGLNRTSSPETYDVTATFSDELMTLLETAADDENVKLNWLDQLNLKITAGLDGSNLGAELAVGVNGKHVLMLDGVLDCAEQVGYVGLPELNEDYISWPVELGNLADVLDILALAKGDAVKKLPPAQDVEQMLRKYKLMIVEDLEVTGKATEELTIDKMTRKCTVISAELTSEQGYETLLKIMEDARKDATAQALLAAACDVINATEKISAGEAYKEEDAQTPDKLIDAMVESIKNEQKANETADDPITVKTYIDMTDQVCGYTLVDADGVGLHYHRLTEENAWEEKLAVDGEFAVIGDGEEKDGLLEGTYTLKIEEENYLHVKLADIDKVALNEGKLRGTVSLIPSDSLTRDIVAQFTDSKLSVFAGLAQPTLELKFAEKALNISAKALGKEYAAVAVVISDAKDYAPAIPEKWVEGTFGLAKWWWETDFDKLFEAMAEAKVPQEYIDFIEYIVDNAWTLLFQ